jgi:hypothetical protein
MMRSKAGTSCQLALIAINAFFYRPAVGIAGMLIDSCSGDSKAYLMCDIWPGYLWPVGMFLCSLYPTHLVVKQKTWWKVIPGVLGAGVVSVVWYFLWVPVLWIAG